MYWIHTNSDSLGSTCQCVEKSAVAKEFDGQTRSDIASGKERSSARTLCLREVGRWFGMHWEVILLDVATWSTTSVLRCFCGDSRSFVYETCVLESRVSFFLHSETAHSSALSAVARTRSGTPQQMVDAYKLAMVSIGKQGVFAKRCQSCHRDAHRASFVFAADPIYQ